MMKSTWNFINLLKLFVKYEKLYDLVSYGIWFEEQTFH